MDQLMKCLLGVVRITGKALGQYGEAAVDLEFLHISSIRFVRDVLGDNLDETVVNSTGSSDLSISLTEPAPWFPLWLSLQL